MKEREKTLMYRMKKKKRKLSDKNTKDWLLQDNNKV